MLDLSNNNLTPDWKRVEAHGHKRVYLKVGEGLHFVDETFASRRAGAHAAGLGVGSYFFAHPEVNPASREAARFADLLPALHLTTIARRKGRDLRPCVDVEAGHGSASTGQWVREFIRFFRNRTKIEPIIYGSPSYLEACGFLLPPAMLWLAAYGRDDGREYPYHIPKPWASIVAHQYSSKARVIGCPGLVDISHVFQPGNLDL